jgi:hypothetical protein
MPKYEYLIDTKYIYQDLEYLNERGEQGWALVSVNENAGTLRYYWRRERGEKEAEKQVETRPKEAEKVENEPKWAVFAPVSKRQKSVESITWE